MTTRTIALLFAIGSLLSAQDQPMEKVRAENTEHMDFPMNGTVRLKNSTGAVSIEGWDEPSVEITTIKSSRHAYSAAGRTQAARDLDLVRVKVDRQGDELVITTDFPKHKGFPPSISAARSFNLDYRIKVPRTVKLFINHDGSDVELDGLTGDIHAEALHGLVALYLPDGGQYAIDASSKFGAVASDFPGTERRRGWLIGHQFNQASKSSQNLFLRVVYGDILILKRRTLPVPVTAGQ